MQTVGKSRSPGTCRVCRLLQQNNVSKIITHAGNSANVSRRLAQHGMHKGICKDEAY